MSVQKETLEKYINRSLIETGTYLGLTTKLCSNIGFDKVYSIELQERLYEKSKKNLKDCIDNNKIELYKGDSGILLGEILNKIDHKTTILLDAHIDGGNFIPGVTPNIHKCPLYKELQSIKNHQIKDHTIIIDDVRILGTVGWGLEVVLDKIIELLKDINPNYNISYEDGETKNDVLIAKL